VIIYIILLWLASLLLGYSLVFASATLATGKSISGTDSSRGFQDAITPPWSTNLTLFSYAASIGAVSYGWYEYGWLTGLGIILGFFFLIAINQGLLLPKSDGEHYRWLILSSMGNRYTDYVKSGDQIRASAMGDLLKKLGIPVPGQAGG
jgi:hypothetical protein